MNEISNSAKLQELYLLEKFNLYIFKVSLWMFMGLFITVAVSILLASMSSVFSIIFDNVYVGFGLIIAQIILIIILNSVIRRLSYLSNVFLFIIYSLLHGITLSFAHNYFKTNILDISFAATAILFLVIAILIKFITIDLSQFSGILIIALSAVIITVIINLLFNNSALFILVSSIIVLFFYGVTVYNIKEIKEDFFKYNERMDFDEYSITGALVLYLDFIIVFYSIVYAILVFIDNYLENDDWWNYT